MTPFLLKDLRPAALPSIPWLSTFPETNLRTYVKNRAQEPGIWFFSLDAARLPAVLGARAAYGRPYMWSTMSVRQKADVMEYRGSRKWPDRGTNYDVAIRIGNPISATQLQPFDHFLTARFRLYTRLAGRGAHADVEHAPWPLAHAQVLRLTQNLTDAAGLRPPRRDPLVQFSPGVDTRIGLPVLRS